MSRLLLLLLGATLWAGTARAEPSSSASAEAGEHFRRGLLHAKDGELGLAARDFEAAYAKSPHYSVLYNLGQAYTALDEPIKAIAAFEQYLKEGGASVDRARHDQVAALIEVNRERLGRVLIAGSQLSTRVWLDGKELTKAELARPLLLAAGQHGLLFVDGSGSPVSRSIVVVAGAQVEVVAPSANARSASESRHAGSSTGRAWLRFAIQPADAHVLVDGQSFGGGELSAGFHAVVVERAGYEAYRHDVELAAGKTLTLTTQLLLAPEQRWRREQMAKRRTAGLVLGGTGGALVLTGVSLLIYNSQRYDDWQAGKSSASESQNLSSAASIQRIDDLSIGLIVLGAGLLGTGTWLAWPSFSERD